MEDGLRSQQVARSALGDRCGAAPATEVYGDRLSLTRRECAPRNGAGRRPKRLVLSQLKHASA